MSRTAPATAAATAVAILTATALATDLAGSRGALADDAPSPQKIIEIRRTGLKNMGAAMKAIVDQLKGATPDEARMAAAAQVIGAAAEQLPGWFPAGTGAEAGVETDALPYIWQNRPKFDSLASQLAPESRSLAAALAGKDPGAVKAQVKVVAELCSSCHHSFRAD